MGERQLFSVDTHGNVDMVDFQKTFHIPLQNTVDAASQRLDAAAFGYVRVCAPQSYPRPSLIENTQRSFRECISHAHKSQRRVFDWDNGSCRLMNSLHPVRSCNWVHTDHIRPNEYQ